MTDTPLIRAIKVAGSQTELARRIGKTQGHISTWLRRGAKTPANMVLRIETATGVSRHELRPDLYPREEAAA